ncbi:hypothetical protein CCAX7_51410 [Capsulimonas corticalis]|uniref:Uncharacterized protein n=1 Tax=Capsulimonas corticalis TaxID=2219043 RepID=A0A402CPD2_9BACT|nr:hypothetical protein [Capsulimonas corticalis]BDI33090.1 hypothetical protein CCAX7_51410 [Capsulimonas corticalis]
MTQRPNPSGQQPNGQTDIIPGVVAVVALALLVMVEHMPPLLAVVLAALTYGGVWLLTRRTPAPISQTELQKAAALDLLGQSLTSRDLARRVRDIAARATSILTYLASNPDQDAQWREYIRECLDATLDNTRRFASLAGRLRDASHPAIRDFTEYTTAVLQTLDDINTKMVDEDAATFSAHIESYQSTLKELNQIYLGKGNTE